MPINWNKIDSFVRSPTTLMGIATVVGTVTSLVTHEMPWAVAVPLLAGSLVAIVVPEKPQVQADVQKAVTDGIAAATALSPTSGIAITADLVKLASEMEPNTPVVAVAPIVPLVAPTFQVAAPVPVKPAAPVLTPAV